jgi:hypothetical protein
MIDIILVWNKIKAAPYLIKKKKNEHNAYTIRKTYIHPCPESIQRDPWTSFYDLVNLQPSYHALLVVAVLLPPSSLMSVVVVDQNCSLVEVVAGYMEPLGLCHTTPVDT